MPIFTVRNIELHDGKLQVLSAQDKWIDLHYKQGEIGGCCAVYSLAFCMLYEQMVSNLEASGRSKADRLLRELFDNHGMIRNGFYFKELKAVIEKYKKKSWDVRVFDGTPKKCVEGICAEIDADIAPIIGIDFKDCNFGHALLAVGYEWDEYDDKPSRLLCLDPAAPAPRTSIWNSYIDVRDLRKQSTYVNDDPKCEPAKCRLADYLVLHDTDLDVADDFEF